MIETLLLSHVIAQEYTMSSLVVGTCYGPEPLLPRSVPDLQFNNISVQGHGFEPEIDTDRGEVTLLESVIGKPPKK